jgi:hypothetical protein
MLLDVHYLPKEILGMPWKKNSKAHKMATNSNVIIVAKELLHVKFAKQV